MFLGQKRLECGWKCWKGAGREDGEEVIIKGKRFLRSWDGGGGGQDSRAQAEGLTLERRNATSFSGIGGKRKVWMWILVDPQV